MVMATGIISIAAKLLDWPLLADALLAVNVAAYAVLWALTLARVIRFPRSVLGDLGDHQRGVGFFTLVAGTGVLGAQFLVVREVPAAAKALLAAAILLWAVITYAVFTALTVKRTKPTLAEGIHGGWLVAVVATEAIANLAALLAPRLPGPPDALLFLSLAFWLVGGMLYIWTISLIFYRYIFFTFDPSDLMPPYWINMGAMAISALAGTTLIAAAPLSPLLSRMVPFLLGFTALFWATATWWIPMLLILGFWRHVIRRFALRYDPLYWGAVFPLGMYAVCTLRVARTLEVPSLLALPRVFFFAALASWTAALLGLARSLTRSFAAARRAVPRAALIIPIAVLIACEPTNRGYSPRQPVVYSHAVHAGALRIPCLYCHYGAERGRYAGIPPARICMNCHTQVLKDNPEVLKVKRAIDQDQPIRWVRIHRLPDFAYFNHSIHVKKGVACQTCHGPIESMGRVAQFSSLTMGWCLDCHRRSWPAARERETVAALNVPEAERVYPPGDAPMTRANRLTDCDVCHH